MLGGPDRLFMKSEFASPASSLLMEPTARMPGLDSSVVLQRVGSVLLNIMERQDDDSRTTTASRTQEDYQLPEGERTFSTNRDMNLASASSAETREQLDVPPSRQVSNSTGRNENIGKHTADNAGDDEQKPQAIISGAFAHRRNPVNDSSSDITDEGGAQPQHIDAANTYHRDVDFEVTLLRHRNKRVLMSRLQEVSPRGRLSLVNLCRRGLGVKEAHLLKEAILANPQLYVLRLSYNELGDEGAAIIASAIFVDGKQHHQLSVLDIGFNSIGDTGCNALAFRCLAGNYNLQTFYFSGNQITERGALSLAGAILHGTGLRSLHLTANHLGPIGMNAIASAIAKNEANMTEAVTSGGIDASLIRRIEELQLGSTSMRSDGFLAIPGMLLSNSSMKLLVLSNNKLDDQDMLLLAQALTQNKQVPLESLHLSFNCISCEGVECLMNAVWGSRTLRELKLDNNYVKDRGAQLCAVVLTSVALETLDLSFNKISTVGIKALMKNISENSSLRTVGLAGIPIDQNASKAISYALAYNTSLQALYLDNCSTGYATQRHIVAGVVSNMRSALRVMTGFQICKIAVTLGMPQLPEEWSNEQVLGFFRLMWEQWLLKSRNGNQASETRGPAAPAAVASAAKIALSSLGSNAKEMFRPELHDKPIAERAPIEPAGSALLERSYSGTLSVPLFSVSSEVNIDDFVDGESKVAALTNKKPSPQSAVVRSSWENPERRNRNLQWLRLHFRALSDVGRLPFHNADLWQLHQYYFSPPISHSEGNFSNDSVADDDYGSCLIESDTEAPGPPTVESCESLNFQGAVSFKTLDEAFAKSDIVSSDMHSNKRRSSISKSGAGEGPASKKPKSLKPRIAYYPRIMAKIQSLGNRPMEQTLSLLRQLKYTENVLFAGKNPYAEFNDTGPDEPCHADIDMILLDLL